MEIEKKYDKIEKKVDEIGKIDETERYKNT